MHPDWEPNPEPFGVQDNIPTNWATLAKAVVMFWGIQKLYMDIFLHGVSVPLTALFKGQLYLFSFFHQIHCIN